MKELQAILTKAHWYYVEQKQCVLATIVKIEGSGYRRQGTRMLISEEGEFTGAISGGCVEKEVWAQTASVFQSRQAKLITYDGRYRLGCEGTLFILIEPILLNEYCLEQFQRIYDSRQSLILKSYYEGVEVQSTDCGTYLIYNGNTLSLNERKIDQQGLANWECFKQVIQPARSLFIFGSEHDAVSLCKIATVVGWDVTIIAHPLNEKNISFFPGAKVLTHLLPEEIDNLRYDAQTACILMSHSFVRDLAYLLNLSKSKIPYIGLLGPHKRKNQLLDQLIEHQPEVPGHFLDTIYGPVGLDIGAERPEEIAVSILAELQAVFTHTKVDHLKNKSGSIHARK